MRSHVRPSSGPVDPARSAREAGLRYVGERSAGIRRRRRGPRFTYQGPDGATLRDRLTRRRIRDLAIPPAWTDVWICPDPRGHLQATGRDARGRLQYRYHRRWRQVRDATKFQSLRQFGAALPSIRAAVERDLARPGLPREKVLATVVRLLETTCLRVGNEEYRRANRTFGLTTLRDRHVEISGARLRFRFPGKGGKAHDVAVTDRRLARIVRRCQEIPGYELFQYLDEDSDQRPVHSEDVNSYLRDVGRSEFTAKHFRTWLGSVHALIALWEAGRAPERGVASATLLACIDHVAQQLGNTRAVCRKSYIHPALPEAYEDGWLFEYLGDERLPAARPGLDPPEEALLRLLEEADARSGPRERETATSS